MYHHSSTPSQAPAEPSVTAPPLLARQGSYGHNWMQSSVKSCVVNDATTQRPCQELKDYLDALLKDINNVVAWWGVCLIILFVFLSY
jgi:hypothetical protein